MVFLHLLSGVISFLKLALSFPAGLTSERPVMLARLLF